MTLDQVPTTKQINHFDTEHLKTNLQARTVRGGAITIAAQVTKMVLQIASTAILARLLTSEDYGLYGMVAAVTGFLALFKDMGLTVATIQRANLNHRQSSTLFWINLGASVFFALLVVAIAPLTAMFYKEPRVIGIMLAIAPIYILGGFGAQHASLMSRQMRFKEQAILNIVAIVLSLTVAITGAAMGAKYWALVSIPLVTASIRSLGAWFLCDWRPGRPYWNQEIRSILSFGSGLTGSTIISYISRNIDNVLIGWYWGPAQLGSYTRAYQLLVAPLLTINAPIRPVVINSLSRLHDSPDRYRKAYLRLVEKITLITMPGVALLIATSDWFVSVFLGEQWTDVTEIFQWLSLVALLLPVTYTTGWLFISQDRSWSMFRDWALTGLITTIAIAIGLPWGATGVAAAYAISGLVITIPLKFWLVGRQGPVRTLDLYRTTFPALCAALATLISLLLFRNFVSIEHALIGIGLASIITVTVSIGTLMILPSGRRALQDYLKLIQNLKTKNHG